VAWDVFQQDDSGSKYAKDAGELGPKMAGVFGSSSLSSLAERLARVTTRDAIDWFQLIRSNGSNIPIALYLRPVFLQDLDAKRLILHLPAASQPGPLKAKINTANSREK
jgi:hypothetical protein